MEMVIMKNVKIGEKFMKALGPLIMEYKKTGYDKAVCTSQTGYSNTRGIGHLFTISPYTAVIKL